MSTEVASFSARKTDIYKIDRKPRDFGSHSSKSDIYVSASKSNKAFEDSLRKPDSKDSKQEKSSSPLGKRLVFGKIDQDKPNEAKNLYFVDLTKKIRKVESPFIQSDSPCETLEKHQASETNMLISSFDSISEKLEDQVESPNSIEKMSLENEEVDFKNLVLEIKEVIQSFECEQLKESLDEENIMDVIQEESQQKSSNDCSLKSKSSESIRMRKKEKKIKKKKQKEMMAKQMKEKLKTITQFVDQLHKKKSHTSRKDLVKELSKHLCEGKFVRLRNQLKKLI